MLNNDYISLGNSLKIDPHAEQNMKLTLCGLTMFHQRACESGITHKRFGGLCLFLVYLQARLDGSSLNYYVAKVK